MYLVEEHYYGINKPILRALGIWPHEKSRTMLLKRFLILLITVPHIFMQFSVFFTKKYTMTFFFKSATVTFTLFGLLLHYCCFILKSKTIINLHHQIREDWKLLRDKIENNIIQQNVHLCRTCIQLIFPLLGLPIIGVTVLQLLPVILDIFFPLDESRSRELLITAEYCFIAHNEYFYYKIVYELVFNAVCWIIAFATGTQLLGFVFHAFGLFKLAKHRIEYSIENCMLHIPYSKKEHAICVTIMHATFAHRRAMEFSLYFISQFDAFYCVTGTVYGLSLIVTLYGMFDAAVLSRNMNTLVVCFGIAVFLLFYIFICHFIGEKIIEFNGDLSICTYTTSWYLMPVSSQKLILFLLCSISREFSLPVGKIFRARIESFAMVIKAAMSYVSVLYSYSKKL